MSINSYTNDKKHLTKTMTIWRKNNQPNSIVADDVVVGRESDGEILGLGRVTHNGRTCKFHYPCGRAVTVGSKVLLVSTTYINDEITGEKERTIQVKMESAKAPGTMRAVVYLSGAIQVKMEESAKAPGTMRAVLYPSRFISGNRDRARSNCWVRLTHSSLSCVVLPGL